MTTAAMSGRRRDAARRLLEDALLRWAELEATNDALRGEQRRVIVRARHSPKRFDLDKILPVIEIGLLETARELLVVEANLRYLNAIVANAAPTQ